MEQQTTRDIAPVAWRELVAEAEHARDELGSNDAEIAALWEAVCYADAIFRERGA